MAAHTLAVSDLCVLVFLLLLAATPSAAICSPSFLLCTMPSPAPKQLQDAEDALPLLRSLELNAGCFFGGEDIHFTKDEINKTSNSFYVARSLSLLPLHAYRTSNTAIFHVAATLTLSGGRGRDRASYHCPRRYHSVDSHSVTFSFEGYYYNDTTSAELCMAGTGSYSEENGSTKRLRSVTLHLRVPNPSSIMDPFITGRLEGIGFEPISLVAYAKDDTYHYVKNASCSSLWPSSAAAASGALQALGANFSCEHLKECLATSYKLQDVGDGPQGFGFRHGKGRISSLGDSTDDLCFETRDITFSGMGKQGNQQQQVSTWIWRRMELEHIVTVATTMLFSVLTTVLWRLQDRRRNHEETPAMSMVVHVVVVVAISLGCVAVVEFILSHWVFFLVTFVHMFS